MLSVALAALLLDATPSRQPLLAYWVMHHDVRPPTSEPWSVRTELPRLVVYDDGLVLLSLDGPLQAVTLTPAERDALLEGADAFFSLPDSITATNRMHPPAHLVTRWRAGVRKTVRFFGALTEPEERAKAPPALATLLDRLGAFRPKTAPWTPEELLLRACKTTAKPDGPRWPATWAKPEKGQPVSYLDGCFEHRVPVSERATAEKLTRKASNLGVVTDASRPWLVTLERFVLPAEDSWVVAEWLSAFPSPTGAAAPSHCSPGSCPSPSRRDRTGSRSGGRRRRSTPGRCRVFRRSFPRRT